MVNQFVVITRKNHGQNDVLTSRPAVAREELSVLPHALFPGHYRSVEIVRLVSVGSDGCAVVETDDYDILHADAYHLLRGQKEDAAASAAAEAARYACSIG